jgi:hypothetical protein
MHPRLAREPSAWPWHICQARDASSSCCSDASCACEVVRGERRTRRETQIHGKNATPRE